VSKCDTCGTELINRCLQCGAPVCCPKCCNEATAEHYRLVEIERLAASWDANPWVWVVSFRRLP
jgi:hypothetical protein